MLLPPLADFSSGDLSATGIVIVGLGLLVLVGIVIVAFVSSYMRG